MSEAIQQVQAKPYLREDGSLCLPLDGDPKYHHWKPGGQSIFLTLAELSAPAATFKLMGARQASGGGECRCGKEAGTVGQIHYCATCLFWWEKGTENAAPE